MTTNRESRFVVEVTDTGVSCVRPNGDVESVQWDDLKGVLIETNDTGPFGTDLWWVLVSRNSGCAVPMGATGEQAMVDRLMKLPGFDLMAMMAAMGSVTNQRFLCWKREEAK